MNPWHGYARRGRPPAMRHDIDRGTAELQVKRAALAQGGDPALSEYPLGVMLTRGLIDGPQHDAGCYYAFLYGVTIGRTSISCERIYQQMMDCESGHGTPIDEAARARIETLFRLGKNRLLAAGRRVCDATENVVVYGRLPRFLDAGSRESPTRRRSNAIEAAAVMAGLEVLVACYGRAAGMRGRMEAHKAPSLVQGGADFVVDNDRNKSV